ncbi:hypothetical protein SmJEL517_g00781 [Synchytrium microbalum]|uniref:Core domain-containing protein n=1 Tax=Synchytrium microbalum TaxID=1806994 RepID=A0A507CBK2_9FUNG|nr:uncharacterized protein SmJEL517_g00781 [Synchytrium microbalum]TPX37002.1 hypothetical protein SmJEL517_g00781 [Synchytrium microbalum]
MSTVRSIRTLFTSTYVHSCPKSSFQSVDVTLSKRLHTIASTTRIPQLSSFNAPLRPYVQRLSPQIRRMINGQGHQIRTLATETESNANNQPTLIVTDRAAKQLNYINSKDRASQALRVLVDSGGCHGYQVKMELTTDNLNEDDLLVEKNGAKVIVDTISLSLIEGSKLDYVQELIGSSFQVVDNPKAESSCGCKTSFNIKI